MNKIADAVSKIASPIVENNNCSLWDVEYVKEGGEWYLRVIIDNEAGVSIDQCENISREIEKVLDEEDLIKTSYILEVSSAGLERVLKRPEDFNRYIGSLVEISLFKNTYSSKSHLGKLKSYVGGNVEIETDEGVLHFDAANVAQVRLRIEF